MSAILGIKQQRKQGRLVETIIIKLKKGIQGKEQHNTQEKGEVGKQIYHHHVHILVQENEG